MKQVVKQSEIVHKIKLEKKETISEQDIKAIGKHLKLYLNKISIHEGF